MPLILGVMRVWVSEASVASKQFVSVASKRFVNSCLVSKQFVSE
jgi:hypothetical protein